MSQIEPYLQPNWDWRAAGNFIGGGSGTGLAIIAAFAWLADMPYWPIIALSMVLVGIGLFCVWLEIGRPWRALHVFFHPETSWMTREAFVSLPFFAIAILAGGVDYIGRFPSWIEGSLVCLTGVIALVYLFCQAHILFASKGIPAWRDEGILPLIITTGIAEGAALVSFYVYLSNINYYWIGIFIIVSSLIRGVSWLHYYSRLKEKRAPKKAIQVLRICDLSVLVLGGLVPIVAAGAVLYLGNPYIWPLSIAGGASLLAGWHLKYIIIAKAAFNQGFALPKLPVRGAGKVSGSAKPGWD
jgi:phenylacetyl-CoA:acceptor oxidoreductase subunit 2